MDRNQAIGLILITILLIAYFQFFSPSPKPADNTQSTETPAQDSTQAKPEEKHQEAAIQLPALPDSLLESQQAGQLGAFSAGASGNLQDFTLSNNNVEITFDNKGGIPKKVLIKKYLTHSKEPLVIMDSLSSRKSLLIKSSGKEIDLYNLYYKAEQKKNGDTSQLIFTLRLNESQYIRQIYSLPPAGYQLLYRIQTQGLANVVDNINPLFIWKNNMKLVEKDVKDSRFRSTITYYTQSGDFESLGERNLDLKEESISQPVSWVAFKQHFFTEAIIARQGFDKANLSTVVDESDPQVVKKTLATMSISRDQFLSGNSQFAFYFGPNNYQILKKVATGFSKNIYLGWTPVNLVNKFLIIPLFNFLENYIGNYGIIIIILVLVIKILLSPLSYKSYLSMAKTKVLKPELDEIKAKYPDDMQKAQQEQMKLYQQVGVNPLSGCIPMVLQMPILFAMFYFFPNSIELRQQPFLWADDLSSYDSILNLPFTIPFYGDHVSLFTLLMTASTILYTWSNNQISTVQGPMKTFSYVMPVIFMFVLNSYSASLSFYYFVANIITFGQQALIRKFVDEDKIMSILNENRLKNKSKKKSVFQLKLEEAMKASEEAKKKRGK